MYRLLFLALLLPLGSMADTVYRTTDAQGNVVFTDTPPANDTPTDRVEIRPTNTAPPPPVLTPPPATGDTSDVDAEVGSYTVTITVPTNETSFPMGPGNFSVSAEVSPATADAAGPSPNSPFRRALTSSR